MVVFLGGRSVTVCDWQRFVSKLTQCVWRSQVPWPLPALISWENLNSTTGELSSSSTCWTHKNTDQSLRLWISTVINYEWFAVRHANNSNHLKGCDASMVGDWTLSSCQMNIKHVRVNCPKELGRCLKSHNSGKGNIWFILVWLDNVAVRKERLPGTDKVQICFLFWNLPHSYSAGTDRTLNTCKQNQPAFMIWRISFVAIITWNCLMRIFILKWQVSFSYKSWGKKIYNLILQCTIIYIVAVLFSIDFQTYFLLAASQLVWNQCHVWSAAMSQCLSVLWSSQIYSWFWRFGRTKTNVNQSESWHTYSVKWWVWAILYFYYSIITVIYYEPCNQIIEAGITRTYVYLWVYHKGLSSLIH